MVCHMQSCWWSAAVTLDFLLLCSRGHSDQAGWCAVGPCACLLHTRVERRHV
uniref:Uncharacterized protein n=1 Tax=Anguilla anguilla TaxID=7936 RepID=A0A0E9PD61_ANGAN